MLDSDRFVVESPYVRRARRPEARFRLFCFPHAGAGASSFAEWPRWLPDDVELVAVQLPGREDRVRERPLTDMAPAVRTLALALRPYLGGSFAFFGHSGGALLAFELARALRQKRGVEPAHLFLSGQAAPDFPSRAEPIHHLPEPEFRAALHALGGTARAVVDNEDLMRLLLPVLRADFTLGEGYRFQPGPPLSTAITALGGVDDDRAPADALEAWRRHTVGPFHRRIFDGGHFYLTDAAAELADTVGQALLHPETSRGEEEVRIG
jgi:medium-chain acyl-[acyl-carrier-protein] hydrolase